MNFNNRCAFITGCAHGIGRAIACTLAKYGVSLAISDIQEKGLLETAELARGFGVRVHTYTFDVSDETSARSAIQNAIGTLGKLDILVNNAGIYNTSTLFVDTPSEVWKQKININILGTMYPTHEILPHMLENGYGRIINIGSVAGIYGLYSFTDYSMTKGAIISFTKALAKEVASKGITVNTVSPGSIDVTGGHNPMTEHSFTGKAGTPEDIAEAVAFLASDDAGYINGQNLPVDGCRKKI